MPQSSQVEQAGYAEGRVFTASAGFRWGGLVVVMVVVGVPPYHHLKADFRKFSKKDFAREKSSEPPLTEIGGFMHFET